MCERERDVDTVPLPPEHNNDVNNKNTLSLVNHSIGYICEIQLQLCFLFYFTIQPPTSPERVGSPGFDPMPGHAKCAPLMEARTSVVLLLVPSLNKLKRLFLEGWKDAIGRKKAMEK